MSNPGNYAYTSSPLEFRKKAEHKIIQVLQPVYMAWNLVKRMAPDSIQLQELANVAMGEAQKEVETLRIQGAVIPPMWCQIVRGQFTAHVPEFVHTCDACQFLGRWERDDQSYDLWTCPPVNGRGRLFHVRRGDVPTDLYTGCRSDGSSAVREAVARFDRGQAS